MKTYLSSKNRNRLGAELLRSELYPIGDVIRKWATEHILFTVTEPDDYATLGNSRIGGSPGLPPNFDWPRYDQGAAFDFVMRINFAELPRMGKELPRQGKLWVFVGDDGSCLAG